MTRPAKKPAGWFRGSVDKNLAKVYVDLKCRGKLKSDGALPTEKPVKARKKSQRCGCSCHEAWVNGHTEHECPCRPDAASEACREIVNKLHDCVWRDGAGSLRLDVTEDDARAILRLAKKGAGE